MRHKSTILLMFCMLFAFANISMAVDASVNWNFSLQSSGGDISWVSASRVNWGYTVYDFNTVMSQFELNLALDGWTDYSDAVDTSNEGAGYDGLPVVTFSRAYDTNGITADLYFWVDEDGYGHLGMTDITFGIVNGQAVSGVRFSGSTEVKGLTLLWEDDFSGYGTRDALNNTTDWTAWDYGDGFRGFWVGTVYANRVLYENDDYGVTIPHLATIDTVSGVYDANHVRFKVDAYKHEDQRPFVNAEWYLMARRTSTQSVRVFTTWGPYLHTIWMNIADSNGEPDVNDCYVADFDPRSPITLELEFEDNVVTGRVTHAGRSTSLSYTTTITQPGKPGIAAGFPWGYAYGYFDDFAIVTTSPVAPQQCGDQGTIYFEGDTNEDCKVDMLDMLNVATDWLDCSDPQNGMCN